MHHHTSHFYSFKNLLQNWNIILQFVFQSALVFWNLTTVAKCKSNSFIWTTVWCLSVQIRLFNYSIRTQHHTVSWFHYYQCKTITLHMHADLWEWHQEASTQNCSSSKFPFLRGPHWLHSTCMHEPLPPHVSIWGHQSSHFCKGEPSTISL
jgi:hypothetical protein